MFQELTERLQRTLRKLRGTVKIDEASFGEVARELRLTLLEADVHFGVVKEFLARVKDKALGEAVVGSLSPGQQVIRIVHEELIELLGGAPQELRLDGPTPHVLMVVGLQGTGKTTTVAKLGNWLRARGRSPFLVSVDVHRPAARDQLRILGNKAGLHVYDGEESIATDLAIAALGQARKRGDDVLLVDTAGRLHIDAEMMAEAQEVARRLRPQNVLYVADALAGQDAVQAATAFGEALELDGHVLTKLDSDARGGASLSVVAVTGLPIFFAGVGEAIDDFEAFHPDRVASRILGMGDVLTLIEKVKENVDVGVAANMEQRARRGDLNLEDFQQQLVQIRKMGPLSQVLEMLPGASSTPGLSQMAPDENELGKIQAIIDSMTVEERRRPQIINRSRKGRIAAGSGSGIPDVNRLLKQFAQTKKMMKKLGKKGRGSKRWANLPGL